jgi:hypothetical protein
VAAHVLSVRHIVVAGKVEPSVCGAGSGKERALPSKLSEAPTWALSERCLSGVLDLENELLRRSQLLQCPS